MKGIFNSLHIKFLSINKVYIKITMLGSHDAMNDLAF